ncbi:VWD domain-containing protein [Runella sp.]|uniref:VWD domain-containing protein n=1 Tax=Runella sp. TaxID=1960881 RepID=UPI003D11D128
MKTYFYRLVLMMCFSLGVLLGCKKDSDSTINPALTELQKSLEDPRPVEGNIRFFITDPALELGIIQRVPSFKVDVLVYGHKDTNGYLKDVTKTIIYNPNTKGWVEMLYDNGYPSQYETSKGYVVELKNYNRSKKNVEVTIKTKADNKIIKESVDFALSAEFFQNIDAYNKYKSGKVGAVNGICNDNTARAVAAAGVAANTFGCVLGITEIAVTGGLAAIPVGVGTLLNCYSAITGLYEAFTKDDITDRYLGPTGACLSKSAGNGYQVAYECVKNPLKLTTAVINCATQLIATEADFYDCGCDDSNSKKNPAHSTADPHLMTHDGTGFDFQSHGEYIATKSTTDNFEIQVRQEDVYKTGRVTMNTGLAVQTGTDVVCVTVKPNRLFVNKQVQDLNTLTALPLKDGASIKKTKDNGRDVINITNKNGDLIKVIIQGTDYLDYYLYLTENRKSKVIGLLGNYDGNKNNDIQIRNGENILINGSLDFNKLHSNYADSWRIAQSNSLFYYDAGKTTDSYTEKDFPRSLQTLTAEQKIKAEATCRAAGVSTEPFLSNCITDVAITNNPEMAKSAVFGQQNDSRNSKPIPIVQEGVDVKTITSGRYFSYLLKTDGTLWACGRSSDGVFGVGNTAVDTKGYFMKIMDGVKDIAKGDQSSHMLILKNDNTVWAFGRNEWGQIGNGVSNATPVFPAVQIMKDAKLLAVTSVSSYIVKTDNSLWAFGQTFDNGKSIAGNVPVKIMDGVKDIAANWTNVVILKTDNSLWRASGFVKIMDNVKSMNVGDFCTMIIKNDNSLWVEGSNEAGQIGLGTLTKSNGYTKLLDDVQSVANGYQFMYILKNDKTLWSVGNNSLGLLGVQTSQRGVLNKVLDDVKSVYCGPLSVFVAKSDNMLWALGNYSDIGYGLENNIYRYKFVPINVK